MNRPLISIVLCTYNGERFLAEQLDSLIAQRYRPVEIVVSDDASTDGTREIIQRYSHYPFIHCYCQEQNLGPEKNFEFATSKATGAFIAFSDQDDIWYPEKLEVLFENIQDDVLVYSDSDLVDEAGNSLELKLSTLRNMYTGNDSRGFIFSNVVWGHAMMISRSLLSNAIPVPEGIPHDIWLAFKATTTGRIKFIDKPLTAYRQHSGTFTKTIPLKAGKGSGYNRYITYCDKLRWIHYMLQHETNSRKEFYHQFYNLYYRKQKGTYVWPLLRFLLKHRAALFQFSRKGRLSQYVEILKQAKGVSKA